MTTEFERFKYHEGNQVTVEVLGVPLRLAQDPSSQHLGTSVWDASIVLAKYLERQAGRPRGDWSRAALAGKRAVELGAGMGLGGMALALLGCDVMLTDVEEVLPLLRRNVQQVRPEALRAADGAVRGNQVGRAEVRELDWSFPEHAERAKAEAAGWGASGAGAGAAGVKGSKGSRSRSRRRRRSSSSGGGPAWRASLEQQQQDDDDDGGPSPAPAPPPPPPFDAILAADCVYSEQAVPVFLDAVLSLSGRHTAILVANERRSSTICDAFERAFSEHFALKRVPFAKLDPEHRHPLIELWQLKRRRAPAAAVGGGVGGVEAAAEALGGLALREDDGEGEGEGEDEGEERDQGGV